MSLMAPKAQNHIPVHATKLASWTWLLHSEIHQHSFIWLALDLGETRPGQKSCAQKELRKKPVKAPEWKSFSDPIIYFYIDFKLWTYQSFMRICCKHGQKHTYSWNGPCLCFSPIGHLYIYIYTEVLTPNFTKGSSCGETYIQCKHYTW